MNDTTLAQERLKAANDARRDEMARLRRENARLMQALEAIVTHPAYAGSEDGETGEPCELIAQARAVLADCRPKLITDDQAI